VIFLAERQLRKPRNELLLCIALELRGNAGQERKLHQIHQVQFADKPQAREPRSARVKRQSAFHAIILQQRLAASHFLQNFRWEVLAIQQQTELRLAERGIIEQC